ncbi:hypothetical protein OCF84_20560 (plasmid) [Shewanella xiamenensis]|uniref:Replication protein n=1 Tax=Shewanella xiamenensis TaxID=332186 RepID=A0ABT6UFU1_9GAMM|nr:hypothetical protein [Shewanella xiamenensis]MDI5833338.1 hypothetical protein [Shewanella xiamenensis]WHF57910.1 hypothetical protein OCF84_20560 [Shewanella xiamenensis]
MSTAILQKASFTPDHIPNHRLIKRFLGMAKAYNWRHDKSLLVLRDVLGMRTYIRSSFISAISAVTQCLISFAQYTPVNLGDGKRALFVVPDQVYVSTIAKNCNVSRYTVYRVLDYLSAIGDCETVTTFNPTSKTYSPTKIVLNSSLFTRIGMPYAELQQAVRTLAEHRKEDLAKEKLDTKFITNRIGKELRPSVKRRLGADAEKLLGNVTTDYHGKRNSREAGMSNFMPESMPSSIKESMNAAFVNDDRKSNQTHYAAPKKVIDEDPRFLELRASGMSVSEALAKMKELRALDTLQMKKSK